jgi:RNA ligase (TIGR02306 family)
MSDKPLAYTVEISELEPIEGKDRIELATFKSNGWRTIVEKGRFEVGGRAVYIETGSILPDKPCFEFLKKRCWSPKYDGCRIRTIRMGGVYSEGILFGFDQLGIKPSSSNDLTDAIGIRRIEDEIPCPAEKHSKNKLASWWEAMLWKLFRHSPKNYGYSVSDFPIYCVKTDEIQAQSIPDLFTAM